VFALTATMVTHLPGMFVVTVKSHVSLPLQQMWLMRIRD